MGESLSLCLQLQSRMDIILLWRHAAPQRSRGRGEFAREFEPHRWEPSATAPATKVQSVTTRNYNIRLICIYIYIYMLTVYFLIFQACVNLSMPWFSPSWFLSPWYFHLDVLRPFLEQFIKASITNCQSIPPVFRYMVRLVVLQPV